MFFKPHQDGQSIRLIKFYCGSTCLYFPLLTITILCTDLMYKAGRFQFLPTLGLIVFCECVKLLFMGGCVKESDKQFGRYPQKYNASSVQKWLSERKLKDILKSISLMILATFAFIVISILFGAEILSKNEETLMFSLLLMVLTVLPPCLHLGPNFALAAILGDEMNSSNSLGSVLQHIVRLTLLGAWLGAFVIPLDWDRPWQEWPLPCCVGALMGYVAAHATAMIQVAMPQYLKNKLAGKVI